MMVSAREFSICQPSDGHELIGRAAPRLGLGKWIGSVPLEVEDLRGQVVLIHWWTDTCDMCSLSVPAFQSLGATYSSQGLQVLGIFHPKPADENCDLDRVQRAARRFRFRHPIALDGDWKALRRWWLTTNSIREFTSVSFLIDRQGIIRYVHPGGEVHPNISAAHRNCNRDFEQIEDNIKRLLPER